MTEFQALLAKKAELEAQIAKVQTERKAEGIAQVRALISEYDLTAADVFPPASAKAAASVGVAKYRDPATGNTWTGRGKPPNWLLGKERDQFLIATA